MNKPVIGRKWLSIQKTKQKFRESSLKVERMERKLRIIICRSEAISLWRKAKMFVADRLSLKSRVCLENFVISRVVFQGLRNCLKQETRAIRRLFQKLTVWLLSEILREVTAKSLWKQGTVLLRNTWFP